MVSKIRGPQGVLFTRHNNHKHSKTAKEQRRRLQNDDSRKGDKYRQLFDVREDQDDFQPTELPQESAPAPSDRGNRHRRPHVQSRDPG